MLSSHDWETSVVTLTLKMGELTKRLQSENSVQLHNEREAVMKDFYRLTYDFTETAKLYGRTILTQLWAKNPVFKDQPIGGIAGGKKYLAGNILFKVPMNMYFPQLATPATSSITGSSISSGSGSSSGSSSSASSSTSISPASSTLMATSGMAGSRSVAEIHAFYGATADPTSHHHALKTTNAEIRNRNLLFRVCQDPQVLDMGLFVLPLMAVINFRGFTAVAVSWMGSIRSRNTLVLGFPSGKHYPNPALSQTKVSAAWKTVCDKIGVGETHTFRGAVFRDCVGPFDVEIHELPFPEGAGVIGTYWCILDTARLLPAASNKFRQSAFLRYELIKSYRGLEGNSRRQFNSDCESVPSELQHHINFQLHQLLLDLTAKPQQELPTGAHLCQLLHHYGINLRYLRSLWEEVAFRASRAAVPPAKAGEVGLDDGLDSQDKDDIVVLVSSAAKGPALPQLDHVAAAAFKNLRSIFATELLARLIKNMLRNAFQRIQFLDEDFFLPYQSTLQEVINLTSEALADPRRVREAELDPRKVEVLEQDRTLAGYVWRLTATFADMMVTRAFPDRRIPSPIFHLFRVANASQLLRRLEAKTGLSFDPKIPFCSELSQFKIITKHMDIFDIAKGTALAKKSLSLYSRDGDSEPVYQLAKEGEKLLRPFRNRPFLPELLAQLYLLLAKVAHPQEKRRRYIQQGVQLLERPGHGSPLNILRTEMYREAGFLADVDKEPHDFYTMAAIEFLYSDFRSSTYQVYLLEKEWERDLQRGGNRLQSLLIVLTYLLNSKKAAQLRGAGRLLPEQLLNLFRSVNALKLSHCELIREDHLAAFFTLRDMGSSYAEPLQSLELSHSRIHEFHFGVSCEAYLVKLDLSYTKITADKLARNLSSLTHLKELNVDGCSFETIVTAFKSLSSASTGIALLHMSNLQPSWTPEPWSFLSRTPRLLILSLNGLCFPSFQELESLFASLPDSLIKLQLFNISFTNPNSFDSSAYLRLKLARPLVLIEDDVSNLKT